MAGPAIPAQEFTVLLNGQRRGFLEIAEAGYHREYAGDENRSEYFVPVTWVETRPLQQAVSEVGFFGNQNTVCQPKVSKWNHTVERLKRSFTRWDEPVSAAHQRLRGGGRRPVT